MAQCPGDEPIQDRNPAGGGLSVGDSVETLTQTVTVASLEPIAGHRAITPRSAETLTVGEGVQASLSRFFDLAALVAGPFRQSRRRWLAAAGAALGAAAIGVSIASALLEPPSAPSSDHATELAESAPLASLDVDALMKNARLAFAEGHYMDPPADNALIYADAVIRQQPDHPEAQVIIRSVARYYYELGNSLRRRGNPTEAARNIGIADKLVERYEKVGYTTEPVRHSPTKAK